MKDSKEAKDVKRESGARRKGDKSLKEEDSEMDM